MSGICEVGYSKARPESVLASIISSGSPRFWSFSHLSMAPLIMCEELPSLVMGSGLVPENARSVGVHNLPCCQMYLPSCNGLSEVRSGYGKGDPHFPFCYLQRAVYKAKSE